MELLRDLDKETVDFQPNYDESLEEPSVLPARFPNLLVNGSRGIAVGMATNIPPHNLGETIDAHVALMLDNPDVTTEELMKALPGPDFPTGGIIMGKKGILRRVRDGPRLAHGARQVRGAGEARTAQQLASCVTEIPYQVNRQRLLEKLGELVRDKKLPRASRNIHDGADRHGIDIIIDLKRTPSPQVVLNKLYKHTQLQVGFGVDHARAGGRRAARALAQGDAALLHRAPGRMSSSAVRATSWRRHEERAHILEGLHRRAGQHRRGHPHHPLRRRPTAEAGQAPDRALRPVPISRPHAILEMRLRRLTGLERGKIEDELDALREKIAYYKRVLSDDDAGARDHQGRAAARSRRSTARRARTASCRATPRTSTWRT